MTDVGGGASAAYTGDGVPGAISAAIVAELDALAAAPRRLTQAAAVAGDPSSSTSQSRPPGWKTRKRSRR